MFPLRDSFFFSARFGPRPAEDWKGRAQAEEDNRGNLPVPSFTLHMATHAAIGVSHRRHSSGISVGRWRS